MNGPLVSIIVPVYNVEAYLDQCVQSIRTQTYPNLQIILVDDGSTDGGGRMCDNFAQADPRVEVIHKKNGGLSSARNAGLDAARGTYIYFVDSDDWAAGTMVEESVSLMERHGYDQCIWGANIVEDGKEDDYMGRKRPLLLRFPTLGKRRRVLCRWLLTNQFGWSAWSRVFRRAIIERNGLRFWNEREIFAEDLDFSLRYLACCQSLYYIPKALYAYRQHSGSIMSKSTLETRTTRMLRMIVRQDEALSSQPLFQPFYIYSGIILVILLKEFKSTLVWQESEAQGLAYALDCLKGAEDWEYLLEQARLAMGDQMRIRRLCGWYWGSRVCAVYQYILNGDYGPLRRWERMRTYYASLRSVKVRLLGKH